MNIILTYSDKEKIEEAKKQLVITTLDLTSSIRTYKLFIDANQIDRTLTIIQEVNKLNCDNIEVDRKTIRELIEQFDDKK